MTTGMTAMKSATVPATVSYFKMKQLAIKAMSDTIGKEIPEYSVAHIKPIHLFNESRNVPTEIFIGRTFNKIVIYKGWSNQKRYTTSEVHFPMKGGTKEFFSYASALNAAQEELELIQSLTPIPYMGETNWRAYAAQIGNIGVLVIEDSVDIWTIRF
jgi:hypothetical protein